MEGRMLGPPAVVLGAELCLRAAYWDTCPKEKVAAIDGKRPGKTHKKISEADHACGWMGAGIKKATEAPGMGTALRPGNAAPVTAP